MFKNNLCTIFNQNDDEIIKVKMVDKSFPLIFDSLSLNSEKAKDVEVDEKQESQEKGGVSELVLSTNSASSSKIQDASIVDRQSKFVEFSIT